MLCGEAKIKWALPSRLQYKDNILTVNTAFMYYFYNKHLFQNTILIFIVGYTFYNFMANNEN